MLAVNPCVIDECIYAAERPCNLMPQWLNCVDITQVCSEQRVARAGHGAPCLLRPGSVGIEVHRNASSALCQRQCNSAPNPPRGASDEYVVHALGCLGGLCVPRHIGTQTDRSRAAHVS